MKNTKKYLISFIFIIVLIQGVFSEQLQNYAWGYSLDLPEGFVMSSNDNNARYQFDHSMLPITLIIASYGQDRYASTQDALNGVYSALQLDGDSENVTWRQTINTVGIFSMVIEGQEYKGWAVSVAMPRNMGTSVFLCYAPTSQYDSLEQVIVSTLDSVGIIGSTALDQGLLTRYAFPPEGDVEVTVEIGLKEIRSFIDKSDVLANEFVVQREYAILTFFAETPLWKEAWQRFYRMIYKDAYKRLQKLSFSIYNGLQADIKQEHGEDFDRVLAQTLLTWVQGFEYERIPLGTDFVPLPAIVLGEGSDCDSRALFLAVLMSHMRYDTMLFVSRDYGHAFFGIAIDGEGARLSAEGISYLLGETTAPVSIGLVPQDMSEISKWIAIEGL